MKRRSCPFPRSCLSEVTGPLSSKTTPDSVILPLLLFRLIRFHNSTWALTFRGMLNWVSRLILLRCVPFCSEHHWRLTARRREAPLTENLYNIRIMIFLLYVLKVNLSNWCVVYGDPFIEFECYKIGEMSLQKLCIFYTECYLLNSCSLQWCFRRGLIETGLPRDLPQLLSSWIKAGVSVLQRAYRQ